MAIRWQQACLVSITTQLSLLDVSSHVPRSSKKIDRNEARISVNLVALKQQAAELHKDIAKKVDQQNVFSLHIRQTKVVRLSYLEAYLKGQIDWDAHVLECMSK